MASLTASEAAVAQVRGRRFFRWVDATTWHHAAMLTLMAIMLLLPDGLVHIAVMFGMVAIAGVAAVRKRRGASGCGSAIADGLAMAVLGLSGMLGASAGGGHHGGATHALLAPPLWAVDAAVIAVWLGMQLAAWRTLTDSAGRRRLLIGCGLMAVQILVMLIWCR